MSPKMAKFRRLKDLKHSFSLKTIKNRRNRIRDSEEVKKSKQNKIMKHSWVFVCVCVCLMCVCACVQVVFFSQLLDVGVRFKVLIDDIRASSKLLYCV